MWPIFLLQLRIGKDIAERLFFAIGFPSISIHLHFLLLNENICESSSDFHLILLIFIRLFNPTLSLPENWFYIRRGERDGFDGFNLKLLTSKLLNKITRIVDHFYCILILSIKYEFYLRCSHFNSLHILHCNSKVQIHLHDVHGHMKICNKN